MYQTIDPRLAQPMVNWFPRAIMMVMNCDYGHNYLRTDACFLLYQKQIKKRKEKNRLMHVFLFACGRWEWAQLSTLNDLDRSNVMCVPFFLNFTLVIIEAYVVGLILECI